MAKKKLHWGIIGTGSIANQFAEGLATSKTGKLVAVGSRAEASATAFIAKHPGFCGVAAYGSYEALLADPNVEAVYIATPHRQHSEWAIKAAEAGKHILCEKPLTTNREEALPLIEAARKHGVFLMEAFMYRCHPQTVALIELLKHKAIGAVKFIRASFGYTFPFDPTSRVYAHEQAGGGILDVGCYPVSMTRLIAGVAQGKAFANPDEIKGVGKLGQSGVDDYALACLKFPGDIVAEISTGVALAFENNVRIVGTEGIIIIPNPWQPAIKGGFTKLLIFKGGIPEEILVEADRNLYGYEADHVAEQIAAGRSESPLMSWDDTLGNLATLDAWRGSIGLRYDWETPMVGAQKLLETRDHQR